MRPVIENQCSVLLGVWVQQKCSSDEVKILAKKIDYKSFSLFSVKKIYLPSEIAIINTALAIFAANVVFSTSDAKEIIDSFLSIARKNVFSSLEKSDINFKKKYESRIAEYFHILKTDNTISTISALTNSFVSHLGLDRQKQSSAAVILAIQFLEATNQIIEILKSMNIQPRKLPDSNNFLKLSRKTGDRRTELIFNLLTVSDEAEKMRMSMAKIVDVYTDSLNDLASDACHFFPTDLAVSIENLENAFSSIIEEVEFAADQSAQIVVRVSKLGALKI